MRFVTYLLFILVASSFVWAQEIEVKAQEDTAQDVVETQPWWEAREGEGFSVQNRRFSNLGHYLLWVKGGVNFNHPYVNTTTLAVGGGYFFREKLLLEGSFQTYRHGYTQNYANVVTASLVVPFVRRRSLGVKLGGRWLPLYAKALIFKKIIYFEGFLGAYLGYLKLENNRESFINNSIYSKFESESHPYASLTTGFHVHLSKDWKIGLELNFDFHPGEKALSGKSAIVEQQDIAAYLAFQI